MESSVAEPEPLAAPEPPLFDPLEPEPEQQFEGGSGRLRLPLKYTFFHRERLNRFHNLRKSFVFKVF